MKFDYLIVGAGFAGSVIAERIATQLNKKVLIVEKRNHFAGNSFSYYDNNGILVHKYGPHIFHTSNKRVWDYISRFTGWHSYFHRVLAVVDGMKIPVPFNLNALYQVFPKKYAEKLEKSLLEKYGFGIKVPILKLKETTDNDLKFLADYIYKNIFYGYTVKQWGYRPEELDYTVTSRVPVHISRDDRYFQDMYQGIPNPSYTAIFEKMLKHPNIHILLNTDYKEIMDSVNFDKMVYTGPIDYFFSCIHGKLPYRSLAFDFVTRNEEFYQETSQVNYPNNYDFTRITEFKHFSGQKSNVTTIAYEYPQLYEEGKNEPYYPIPMKENDDLYSKYALEADKLKNTVHFVGRLADYKYYNMDQIIGVALHVFEKKIAVE